MTEGKRILVKMLSALTDTEVIELYKWLEKLECAPMGTVFEEITYRMKERKRDIK